LFDLRCAAPADATWKRGGFVTVVTVLVSIAVEITVFAWSVRGTLLGPGLDTVSGFDDIALLGLAFGALGFGVTGFRRVLPGARWLAVDDQGVHLHYSSMSQEDFLWQDGTGFVLRDYGNDPELVQAGIAFQLLGPRFWCRRTLLTREALVAVLAEARRQGVVIAESEPPAAAGGRSPITYNVRTPTGSRVTTVLDR
jgi:hypothetical protein